MIPPSQERDESRRSVLGYQPGLDGLRGLAVLAVLFYHEGTPAARGGFLGVDVFFVLSGFLITTLLVEEWRRSDRIDLRAFWTRRAKRLLPALLLLLVGVALYAAFVAGAGERASIRVDGFATLFYVENWRLVFAHKSYFDQFSAPSPLRHAWSLAIEEQWYLFWPITFGALLRWARGSVERLLPVVLVLAGASAGLMALLYRVGSDPSRVYYGTDTRAQSLLLGSALALVVLWRGYACSRAARIAIESAGIAGGLCLVWFVTHVYDTSAFLYRGGLFLIAVASVCLIAAAVQPRSVVVRRVLAFEPLRRIGLISYGVYLFHWPIFLWLNASRTNLTGAGLLALRLAVTFAIAIASYWLIEMPVRRRRRTGASLRVLTPAIAVAVMVALVASTLGSAVTSEPASVNADVGGAAATRPGAIRVLIAGDSQAETLGRPGPRRIGALGVRFAFRAVLGCGIVDASIVVSHQTLPAKDCSTWPAFYATGVQALDPQVAVLDVGVWELADHRINGRVVRAGTIEDERYLDQQLDVARNVLTAQHAQLALLTMPCAQVDSANSMSQFVNDATRAGWLNEVWRRYAKRFPTSVSVIDLRRFLCPGGVYQEKIDGVVVRADGLHYTPAGALLVWRWLTPQLRVLALRSGKKSGCSLLPVAVVASCAAYAADRAPVDAAGVALAKARGAVPVDLDSVMTALRSQSAALGAYGGRLRRQVWRVAHRNAVASVLAALPDVRRCVAREIASESLAQIAEVLQGATCMDATRRYAAAEELVVAAFTNSATPSEG